MKRILNYTIIFFILVHVLFPLLLYIKFGFFFVLLNHNVEDEYFIKATVVISVYCLVALIILNFLPKKRSEIKQTYKYPIVLLFFQLFLSFYKFSFGYMAEVPIIARYFSQFMNPMLLFIVITFYFFLKKDINKIKLCIIIYLTISLLSFSRAGIFILFFIFGAFYFFDKTIGKYIIKKMYIYIIFGIICAPILYTVSSNNRYHENRKFDVYTIRQIGGRLSILESAAGVLKATTEDETSKQLFLDKYGICNQLRISLNTLSPFDFFENDAAPNQYYRMIVNKASQEEIENNYVSINIGLPIYFYLKYGFLPGLIFFSSFLFVIFLILIYGKQSSFKVAISIYVFYMLILYFDWQDIFDLITKFYIFNCFIHILFDNSRLLIFNPKKIL